MFPQLILLQELMIDCNRALRGCNNREKQPPINGTKDPKESHLFMISWTSEEYKLLSKAFDCHLQNGSCYQPATKGISDHNPVKPTHPLSTHRPGDTVLDIERRLAVTNPDTPVLAKLWGISPKLIYGSCTVIWEENNNIHRRPDSAVHYTGDDYVLGNLKLSLKVRPLKCFGNCTPRSPILKTSQCLLYPNYLKCCANTKKTPRKSASVHPATHVLLPKRRHHQPVKQSKPALHHKETFQRKLPQNEKGKTTFKLFDEDDERSSRNYSTQEGNDPDPELSMKLSLETTVSENGRRKGIRKPGSEATPKRHEVLGRESRTEQTPPDSTNGPSSSTRRRYLEKVVQRRNKSASTETSWEVSIPVIKPWRSSRRLRLAGPDPEPMSKKDQTEIKSSGSMSSLKNLDDTVNFGDQFLHDQPTEDDQEKSKAREESDSNIPDPSHQTVYVNSSRNLLPFTTVTSSEPSLLVHSCPPINTEATTNTDISSLKSLHSSPLQLRVADWTRDFPERTKLDDALLKVLERHTADLIEKYSVLPGPESVKNQESEKTPKEIIKAKKEQDEEKQDSTYSIRSTDKRTGRPPWIRKVADQSENHRENMILKMMKNDDDEGPSAGSNQGRSTKKRRSDSAASGSAKPPPKDDDQSSQKPRESDASASKQHPSFTSTGWQITDTRDTGADSSMHKSDPESEHSEQSSDDISKQDKGDGSDMEDTDNAHIPKVSTTTWFKPIPESERPATPEPEWTIPPNDFPEPEHNCKVRTGKKKLCKADLEGPAFNLAKAFHKNSVFLQYQMDECHKLLTNKVDWSNPEGHQIQRNIYEPHAIRRPHQSEKLDQMVKDFIFSSIIRAWRPGSGQRMTMRKKAKDLHHKLSRKRLQSEGSNEEIVKMEMENAIIPVPLRCQIRDTYAYSFKLDKKKCRVDTEVFREILQICPRILNQDFVALPSEEDLVTFIQGVTSSNLVGMYNKKNVDYVTLLWEDFIYQADNKEISSARKDHMTYPRFTNIIINHFISKDKTISMRNRINLHTIRDDSLLGTLKFVSKTQDYQQYGALIPDDMINQDIKDSQAYKTYYDFATGKVPPRKARKYKNVASPSTKLSPVKEAETVKKGKRVKRSANKSTTAPTTVVVLRDTPGVPVSKKKAPAKGDRSKGIEILSDVALSEAAQLKEVTKRSKKYFHISQASGSGDGIDLKSGVPDEQQCKTSGTDEGTGTKLGIPNVPTYDSESKNESWGDSEDDNDDDSDDVSKGDDDKADSDDDGNSDADDNERTDSDDDDENPSFTLKDYNEEEHDEEYESDDDYENMFEEEDDDDLYKDVDVRSLGTEHEKERQGHEEMTDADQNVSQELSYEQVIEDAHVTLTALQKTDGSKQSSSVSSDFASKFLILENVSPAVDEVSSMMHVKKTATAHATTVSPTISMITPLPQLTTPSPAPTTIPTTTSIPALPDFSSLFGFDQGVSTLETEFTRIGYATRTALESYTKDFEKKAQEERKLYIDVVEKSVKDIIKDEVKSLLPQILHKEVSDFATPVIQSTITESLNNVVLAETSSQPQSTYETAASLTEFELNKILIDKLEKSKSYRAAEEHKNLYDALIKSYQLDKDLFDSYGKAYSLKRSRDDKDKDEDPPAGSDQGLKKRKKSKDSAQAEEPVFETTDTEMPQDQGDDMGNTEDQPNVETASKHDWFKKPERPPTLDPDWNVGKQVDFRPPQTWISQIAKAEKPHLSFDELMSTPIDFSAFVMNHLKIDNLTQQHLVGPTFNLLKGTCKSRVELEYHFEECYKAVTDRLDWTNPEGHQYPFDLSKPLPLIEVQGRQVVPADYFINNDLEYLKGGSLSRKYTTSITKPKAAKYDMIEGIEDMVRTLWSPMKVTYDKYALWGI
ncbi:hypothetical protein Tco_1019173 [Tanacetum coccineum]|uniref:Reverse transcriptase domain-containing protein n=1 Tax=Tanacetum coccineum TaxID=301880 RepID=A0ABQ5FWF4_9ASTR